MKEWISIDKLNLENYLNPTRDIFFAEWEFKQDKASCHTAKKLNA